MNLPLTPEQQQEIDTLLFKHYAIGGLGIDTLKRYREFTGVGINDAVEALVQRRDYLRDADSSRFEPEPDWHLLGLNNLSELRQKERVVALVGEWDEDSSLSYVHIYAITEGSGEAGHQETRIWLTQCLGGDTSELTKCALSLGNELAAAVDVDFVLQPWDQRR